MVTAVAFDTPITGWRGRHVNTLRLWYAQSVDPFRLDAFNRGDHVGALADRVRHEAISLVLYPSDESPAGQELRLRQEFFFASASLQDLLRRHRTQHGSFSSLPEHAAIQLNDTHPAIAIAEMMRLLVDVHGVAWEEAWRITTGTFNYTNHTLLPEALETWSVPLLERLLPRHMQIIYLINSLHLDALRAEGHKDGRLLSSVSLIQEDHGRRVRMGNLAFLGARRVNGVSALHTELMRKTVFHDFATLYPDRIVNKTNGITFRRWLYQANPGADPPHRRRRRRRRPGRRRRARAARSARRRRGVPRPLRGRAAHEQGGARAADQGAHRRQRRSGRAVRRAGQARSTNTSASSSTSSRRSRSTTRCARSRRWTGCRA